MLLLIALGIALTLPQVQTKIAQYATESINKEYKTDIQIEQIAISIYGGVKLKKVLIRDHHKDTLIAVNRISTCILDVNKLINGQLIFGALRLDQLMLNIKTYKRENDNSLNVFIAAFDDGKPSSGKFLLTSKDITLKNSRLLVIDENREVPKDIDFTKLNAELQDFRIEGPNVNTIIDRMSFQDHRGLFVRNLESKFSYTKKQILLTDLDLMTAASVMKGNVALNYKLVDFEDFNNKVQFNILLDQASISSNDIRYFYKEIGKNQNFTLKAHVTGTLNDLTARGMKLRDSKSSEIIGNVNFKNLFGKANQPFYMKGDFKKVASTYQNLIQLLPNVLGTKLPSTLKKLGRFDIRGDAEITTKTIVTDFYMSTALGNIQADLNMSNIDNIDNANYKGNVILEEFNIGSFIGDKQVGKVTLNIDVDGKGFKQKNINTTFSGDIYKLRYNNYTYTKVIVDGIFKNPIFIGKVNINDPNLFLDFKGLVNLSKKDIAYNFQTTIDYANLRQLNFVKNDSIAIVKGEISCNVNGNNFDDLKGDINVNHASYQNNQNSYYFEALKIQSSFDAENVRTIAIESPDVVQGKVVGKFKIGLLKKMLENSAGSLYANYSRNPIPKGQYFKFDFNVDNKIVEAFFPEINIAKDTKFRGAIDSTTDDFKFNFTSPEIKAFGNAFDNIKIEIDNKNPLYNTYIAIDSIKTKQYKASDFSLINITTKDTLFLRSEFKGGEKAQDKYSLNFYHTIDNQRQNIVGIQKSELLFNNFLWYLNEEDNDKNKIIFDKKFKEFTVDDLVLSHGNQKVKLGGKLEGKTYKDLSLNFTDVELEKLLPEIDQFKINGTLNGVANVQQTDAIYRPTAAIKIDDLIINEIALGNMNLDISGDDSFRKFYLNSSIENKNVNSFEADGSITVVNENTELDLNLNFDRFNLGILSSFGGSVISNIRGFASGRANIGGNVKNMDINGRLFVDKAGLGIPYLNTDYQIQDQTIVDVTEKKFIIRKTEIEDTKHKTKGNLYGTIGHTTFSDWNLDLNLSSNRILALDTKDSEDAAYFGSAYMDGIATIVGPIGKLFIKVDGKSEKGTAIKIPISDAEGTGDSNYIHFITPNEKYSIRKGLAVVGKKYDGVELEFNFDITPEAEVEIILDRNSGHGMKGKGFGSLLFKINTLGKFNMWGDFQAYEGTYNFKYGGIINKQFKIKKGGSIIWEGDPMKAVLNLEAVYYTNANPALLIENSSFNKKVDVEVVIGLKGNLANPNPDFTINFPTVSSVLKSEIQTSLDDKDVRQKQALILLSTGNFLSVEGINQTSLTNNLYEKVGDIFGSILNDAEDKITVGVDLVSADRNPGRETDGRVGVTVSTKLSERISINGKLGVPVGGINQSAVVGDVEILYRVNEDGTLNLHMFNKENDINYIGQGIGYTQGIGINYQVDFTTFKQLLYKIFKNQKIELVSPQKKVEDDSNLLPDYINFEKKEEKEKTPEKVNSEAIPNED